MESEFEVVQLSGKDNEDMQRVFATDPPICSKIIPGDWLIKSRHDIVGIRNFQVYDDDIWIVTPPKCGTTWMQELAWLIVNNVDLETAQRNQFFRIPYIDLGPIITSEAVKKSEESLKAAGISDINEYPGPEIPHNQDTVLAFMYHSLEFTKRMPRPRMIKTHLPVSLLPRDLLKTGKVIYVGRNVKDAAVSFFHHMKLEGLRSDCDFATYADLYKRGLIVYSPLIQHVLDAWMEKDNPNMFFTTYEEMSRDLRAVALKLIRFIGKDENSLDVEKLLKAVNIESFRKNNFVNKNKELPPDGKGNAFIRKGEVGDWRNYFDKKMNAEWDPWIEEQLKGSDFKMEFDLN